MDCASSQTGMVYLFPSQKYFPIMCNCSNWVPWKRVNQSEHFLRTKNSNLFLTKPITLRNANNSSITNWTLNKSMKCCRLITLYPRHWFWFSCCKMRFQAKFLEWNLSFGYFAVMDWFWTVHVLVHVLVRTLAWFTALCSYARHFTFKVPLPTKLYKWLLENLIGDNHAMD